jgi:hypothetical protein
MPASSPSKDGGIVHVDTLALCVNTKSIHGEGNMPRDKVVLGEGKFPKEAEVLEEAKVPEEVVMPREVDMAREKAKYVHDAEQTLVPKDIV